MNNKVWKIAERMQGQIARQLRILLGEEAYDQRIFTDAERERRIEAMKLCAAANADDADDAERHISWCKMHTESGWVYGEKFDPAAKTHPNLLPWDELPASTRVKAKIFDIVSRAAEEMANA